MNEAERKVLKTMKAAIVRNLILNDEILDSLEERDVLKEDMIQNIKAERTHNDKIVTLLFILTRRGPTAFKEFVEAIRPDFSFLSDMLEEAYVLELEDLKVATADSCQETPIPSISIENSREQEMQTSSLLCSKCSQHIIPNREIKEKKMSSCGTSDFMQRMMQDSFRCWYTKLKSHMTNMNLRELSFKSPEPVTYDMVDKLLDELIQTVDGCYGALGVKDNIVTQIIELKESKKKLKQELKHKEEQKNKYAGNMLKLENKCINYCEQIETTKRQNQKLHSEIITLKKEREVQLQEKDNEIDKATAKYTDAMEQLKKFEQMLQAANDNIEKLENNIIHYEKQTKVYNWQLQGANNETRRCYSRNKLYDDRNNMQVHTSSPRRNKHSMHTESTVSTAAASKQVTEVKHKHSQCNADFIAVEEPHCSKQKRTETFVQTCCKTSHTPIKNLGHVQSATSDKENNAVSIGQQTLRNKNNNDDDSKGQNQQLMVNTDDYVDNTAGGSVTRRSRSRRTPIYVKPKSYAHVRRSQASLGITGTNAQKVNRGIRQAPDGSPRVLDTLMIVCNNSNNSPPMHNESQRGPKAMKKHH